MILNFSKGHGTGNDFVLIFDPHDEIDLKPNEVAALCDRSFGIGADGLIRIVNQSGIWFMDYRNSDGSLAEICGNGTRVMSRFLVENSLVTESNFPILTRAGKVEVSLNSDDSISVVLGPVMLQSQSVEVTVNKHTYSGRLATAPNPHVISIVENLDMVGNLLSEPEISPQSALPAGANFEFITLVGPREVNMRVHERGVGETLSCGSGACAVAVFMQDYWDTVDPITVQVPGGKLILESMPNNHVKLTGPAVIVATGQVDLAKLEIK